jgi:hypothetical protein
MNTVLLMRELTSPPKSLVQTRRFSEKSSTPMQARDQGEFLGVPIPIRVRFLRSSVRRVNLEEKNTRRHA